jgi:hypothetical protein
LGEKSVKVVLNNEGNAEVFFRAVIRKIPRKGAIVMGDLNPIENVIDRQLQRQLGPKGKRSITEHVDPEKPQGRMERQQ